MRSQTDTTICFRLVMATAFFVLASGTALAAPMRIEAVIIPKADSKLEFQDGSRRYLLAAHREGNAAGNGPLAGASVLEWGLHDVNPAAGAEANGYLIFTTANGDKAYLKYRFRAVRVPGPDGKPRFLANGFWETAGGTGTLKDVQGGGTVRIDPKERRWILEGDLVATQR